MTVSDGGRYVGAQRVAHGDQAEEAQPGFGGVTIVGPLL